MGYLDHPPENSTYQTDTEHDNMIGEQRESKQSQQHKETKESHRKEPTQRGGRTPAEPIIEEYPGDTFSVKDPENPLYITKEINGIKMEIYWDSGYGDYVLYFPNMRDFINEDDEEESLRAGSNEVFRISRNPQKAEQVLGYAEGVALLNKDPFKVSEKVQQFIDQLPIDKLDE